MKWGKLFSLLGKIHEENSPRGYNPLKMFKVILLGQWHSLNDPGLDQS